MSIFGLVHGCCQTGWVWHRVISELAIRGHQAVAMDLPLEDPDAGASEYAEAVVHSLEGTTAPVVVVGHSMAGAVIPVVAARRPVARLVFLAAAVFRCPCSFCRPIKRGRTRI